MHLKLHLDIQHLSSLYIITKFLCQSQRSDFRACYENIWWNLSVERAHPKQDPCLGKRTYMGGGIYYSHNNKKVLRILCESESSRKSKKSYNASMRSHQNYSTVMFFSIQFKVLIMVGPQEKGIFFIKKTVDFLKEHVYLQTEFSYYIVMKWSFSMSDKLWPTYIKFSRKNCLIIEAPHLRDYTTNDKFNLRTESIKLLH